MTPRIEVHNYGEGLAHARGVVGRAAQLAKEDSSTYEIRSLATQITHGVPSKQTRRELEALYKWVRDNIRYRFDPVDVEWLQRPTRTVAERAGDCDDMATLLASFAQSLGHRVRWRVVGPRPGVPKHIASEAWVKHPGAPSGEWVSLDPVLEPAQETTAPRADLGKFGQRAPGAEHIFSEGGVMLNGVVDSRGRELWQWVEWFHPPEKKAQIAPVPIDLRYRIAGQPSDPRRVFAAYRAELQRNMQPGGTLAGPFYDPTLGFGFLKILKPLAKVASVVGVPGAGAISAGLDIATSLTAKGKKAPAPGAPAMPQAVPLNATPITAAARAPVVNCATPQAVASVQKMLTAHVKGDKVLQQAAKITIANDKAAKKRAAKRKEDQRVEKRAKQLAAKMVADLRAQGGWPRGARQSYDPRTRSFQVYAPTTMGAIGFKPSFAVSFGCSDLGAAGRKTWVQVRPYNVTAHRRKWPGLGAATSGEANAAIRAVETWIRNKKTPPLISLQPVLAFQIAVGNLDRDGLWGPNTRRAAAYYSGRSERALPAVAARFAKLVATWAPPTSSATPAPVVQVEPGARAVTQAPVSSPNAVRVVPSSESSPVFTLPIAPPIPSAPAAPSLLPSSAPVLAPIAIVPDNPGLPMLPGSPSAPPSSNAAPPPFPGDPGSTVIVAVDDLAPFNEQWSEPPKDNTWLWLLGAWYFTKRKRAA